MEPNRTRETVRAANENAEDASRLWRACIVGFGGQHGKETGGAYMEPERRAMFRARRIAARKRARLANRAHAAALAERRAEARAFARAAFRTSALAAVFSEIAEERRAESERAEGGHGEPVRAGAIAGPGNAADLEIAPDVRRLDPDAGAGI